MEDKSFLGKGWGFPITFNMQQRSVQMVSEEEDIKQSLKIIISTIPGDHPMDPSFGCEVQNSMFETMNANSINRIRDSIEMAIVNYEPRVILHGVVVDNNQMGEGVLAVKIDYTIESVNIRTNMVYPYYYTEGTDL
jgi:phage baseplate assembly protein W